MKRALPAIAAAAAVAMAPVVRAETFYLGGTGTVGTPSAASMAYLISTGMIDDPKPDRPVLSGRPLAAGGQHDSR
jgi:hypothetical protein